jgi:hypothetical protein
MKYNLMTRRMFLIGMRNTALAIPFMESMLPRQAWGQTTAPLRFSMFVSNWSGRAAEFYGTLTGNQRIAPHVNIRDLRTLSGNISPIFGTEFNEFKSQILLLRGLDCLGMDTGHEGGVASTASANPAGTEANNRGVLTPPAARQASVDMMLAQSNKVYSPNYPTDLRHIGAYSGYSESEHTWSWSKDLERKGGFHDSASIYNVFRNGFTSNSTAPINKNEPNLIQGVYDEYRSLRDSRKISSSDKLTLEAYMNLISDIQKGFETTAKASTCTNPTLGADSRTSVRVDNQLKVIAAAMACNLTKISSMGLFFDYSRLEQLHQIHHNIGRFSKTMPLSELIQNLVGTFADNQGTPYIITTEEVQLYFNEYNRWARHIAGYMKILSEIKENGVSILDNTLIYHTQRYGMAGDGDSHVIQDYAVMLAGGAGGMLNTGYYVDYRHETDRVNFGKTGSVAPGLPLNNLMVTIFNCFGLNSADYERGDRQGQGYGDYGSTYLDRYSYRSTISSTNYRRSPLPFIYKGPPRG